MDAVKVELKFSISGLEVKVGQRSCHFRPLRITATEMVTAKSGKGEQRLFCSFMD